MNRRKYMSMTTLLFAIVTHPYCFKRLYLDYPMAEPEPSED